MRHEECFDLLYYLIFMTIDYKYLCTGIPYIVDKIQLEI